MEQKKLKLILMGAGGGMLVIGIALFILGCALAMPIIPRIFAIISAVLCIALALLCAYLLLLMQDKKQNYFLYSYQAKRNIPVQKLTFQTVNSRMNRYLSGYASSEGKIWTERVLDNPYLEMNDVFKPLVAYKLLFDLAEYDSDNGWKFFEIASEETVDFICRGLEMNGDSTFASTLRQVKASKPLNLKFVRDYLVKNKKYIAKKMFVYVYDNIQSF